MIKKIKERCETCGKELPKWGSVSLTITNPWQRYHGSGRSFKYCWSFKFCKKDLTKFLLLIYKFIEGKIC